MRRVYRVTVDGQQLGEVWTHRPLVEYLRLLKATGDYDVIRVEEADLSDWRPVGIGQLRE